MPTVGWILETAIDRYWERGRNHSGEDAKPIRYKCRVCHEDFASSTERDFHELTHPVRNPMLIIGGSEVSSSRLLIKHKIEEFSVECKFTDKLIVNGRLLENAEIFNKILSEAEEQFFLIELVNEVMHKRLEIDVKIAKSEDLVAVDELFLKWFRHDDFNDYAIEQFIADTKNYTSVVLYVDGIVRYLQGVMAKDLRTKVVGYEDYYKRFNQSLDLLLGYDTPLSQSLTQLIKFSLNDFTRNSNRCGVPSLDKALDLFEHKENANMFTPTKAPLVKLPLVKLPVDRMTGLILDNYVAMYEQYSLEQLEYAFEQNNTKTLSQQDSAKLYYLAYCKAIAGDFQDKITHYSRRLKFDGAFEIYPTGEEDGK
jgi:hypothetical protein